MAISVGRALGWGVTVAVVTTVATLAVSFLGRLDISVPGVLEVTSSDSADRPETSFVFNPLATIVFALLLATLIWGVGQIRSRRRANRIESD